MRTGYQLGFGNFNCILYECDATSTLMLRSRDVTRGSYSEGASVTLRFRKVFPLTSGRRGEGSHSESQRCKGQRRAGE